MSIDATPHDPTPSSTETEQAERKWKPLNRIQRRVAGVLVEKAKTTPENYPLSLNALTNGCNQKSNRSPQMNLAADDVELALDELRDLGAVVEIQSGGRVAKYKHCLYDWLAVDKAELAVMAELLLRGEQTIGELRGRAARMEPIADLAALRPILSSLVDKGLIVELTPEGRGQVVSHSLYEAAKLAQLQKDHEGGAVARPAAPRTAPSRGVSAEEFSQLQSLVEELRTELDHLKERFRQLVE